MKYRNYRKKMLALALAVTGALTAMPQQAYAGWQESAACADEAEAGQDKKDIKAQEQVPPDAAVETVQSREDIKAQEQAPPDVAVETVQRQEDTKAEKRILEKKAEAADEEQAASYEKKASLAAPQALTAKSITYRTLKLYWDAVEKAARYRIEYSLDGVEYQTLGRTANTKYGCKNLLTGRTYYFRVCALDKAGNPGAYSAEVTAKPYLRRTTILTADTSDGKSVALTWKKIAGAQGYEVYRKKPEEKSYQLVAQTAEPACSDATPVQGVVYQYRVRAVRDVEGKKVRATLSRIMEASVALEKAEFTACEAVELQTVRLAWEKVPDADGYMIYRSTKEDGTYQKLCTIDKNTVVEYEDQTIVPGRTYFYRISIYKNMPDGGQTVESELSQPVSAQAQLAAPQFLGVKNTDTRSLALSWNKVADATGYRVYRSLYADKKFTLAAELASGSMVGYEDRAVSPGVTYYYKVKAVFQNGKNTGVSGSDTCHSGMVAPSAPIGMTIRQTATDELSLSWLPSEGALSYRLYRATKGNGKYVCIAQDLTDTAYTDTGLTNGRTYFYRLVAAAKTLESTQSLPVRYTVGGVSLASTTLKVGVGISKKLAAFTVHEGEVLWTSANPKVATVDSEGVVTGVSFGTTTVTATVAGRSATATVSVTAGTKNGMDVSVWQKDVDWARVKNFGIDFAFIRISNHYLEDYTFETKYANAAKAGVPLGVYCYSRAVNVAEAEAEARMVLQILDGRPLDYPIAMDLEDSAQKKLSKTQLLQMVKAFKKVVEDAGYRFVLYSYTTFLNSHMDIKQLGGIDLWIARYRNMALGTGYTGTGNEKYWQYNSGQYSGTDFHVDGVTDAAGNLVNVDVNLEY